MDFKVENTKIKIQPGPAVPVRFFVQYNPLNTPIPRLQAIRLNGREICNANTAQPPAGTGTTSVHRPQTGKPETGVKPVRPVEDKTRPSIKPEDTPVTRPVHGFPSNQGPVYVPTSNPPIEQVNVNPYVM